MFKSTIIALVLGVLVVGGGVYTYTKSKKTSAEILTASWDKISSSEYVNEKISGVFTVNAEALGLSEGLKKGATPKISFSIDQTLNRDAFWGLPDSPKSTASVKLSFEDLLEDPVSISLDVIAVEKLVFYLKLNELTGSPMDISSFTGKWWKFDLEALIKNFAGADGEELLKTLESSDFSEAKLQELEALWEKHKSAFRVFKLPDEETEGSSSYHFAVSIDENQMKDVIVEAMEVIESGNKDAAALDKTQIKKELDDALKNFKFKSLDLFIGKGDYVPMEVKFKFDFASEHLKETLLSADVTMVLSDSKSVVIEAPADSTDILYLLGNLMTASGLDIPR